MLVTYIEIFFKFLYFYSNFFYKVIRLIKKTKSHSNQIDDINFTFDDFKNDISTKFSLGDTIIVHSSNRIFKRYNITPNYLLDFLLTVVGESGNLIIPSIPLFKEPIPFNKKVFMDSCDIDTFYDPERTRPWTGLLSFAAMSYPGFVRSINPLNTMSVIGCDKYDLVRNDLFSSNSLPCDKNSVLGLSLKYNSKILFLDVDPVHSMTLIHCIEDMNELTWPIKNWYWNRNFSVKIGGEVKKFILKERRPFWSIFFAQKRLTLDLKYSGILKNIESTNISFCNSIDVINFMKGKNPGYPYFVPFWMKK